MIYIIAKNGLKEIRFVIIWTLAVRHAPNAIIAPKKKEIDKQSLAKKGIFFSCK